MRTLPRPPQRLWLLRYEAKTKPVAKASRLSPAAYFALWSAFAEHSSLHPSHRAVSGPCVENALGLSLVTLTVRLGDAN